MYDANCCGAKWPSPPHFFIGVVRSFGGTQTTDLWENDVRLFWEHLVSILETKT
jgi:hypothetical protein